MGRRLWNTWSCRAQNGMWNVSATLMTLSVEDVFKDCTNLLNFLASTRHLATHIGTAWWACDSNSNKYHYSLGNSGLCWTVYARNRDTAVPAEGNGDSQTLMCPCGETQTMSHIVESCPLTKLNGGLSQLHSAEEDAVSWLTSYGSWNAYQKKKC